MVCMTTMKWCGEGGGAHDFSSVARKTSFVGVTTYSQSYWFTLNLNGLATTERERERENTETVKIRLLHTTTSNGMMISCRP